MKKHARADVPRLLAAASPDARRRWERGVDFENLGGLRLIAVQLKNAMRQVEPMSDAWWKLKAQLDETRAEVRALRLKLYGKWLAVLGLSIALTLAFGAGVVVGMALR